MSPEKENKKGGQRLAKNTAKPKKPKPQRDRKQVIQHRLFIAATVLSAVIVALFVIYNLVFVKPNVNKGPDDKPGHNGGTAQTTLAPGQTPGPTRNPDRKSEDFYTFLVAGRDTGGGGNTDVVMVASYDVTNQKLNVMNIPRDTMVNLGSDIKKINAVYNAGGGKKGGGIDALKATVGDTVGFVPDFYVIVEWEAVGRLATAIGGVDFDVPVNMYYDDPTQNLSIHISKGQQHLNGEQVMKVLRFRKNNDGSGYASGDIGRIETQQKLLKEVVKKLLKVENVTKIQELTEIFAENVETDLSVQNIFWLAKAAVLGGLDMDNVNFVTIPANYNGFFWSYTLKHNESYVFPNVDELLALVNADFNPYKEDVTEADLKIMYKNKDGTIACTNDTVKDTKANQAWLAAKNAPKATPTPDPDESKTPEPTPSATPKPGASPTPSPKPTGAGGTDAPDRGTPPPEASPSATPDTGGSQPPEEEPPAEPTPAPTPEPTPEPTPDPNAPPAGIPIF